MFLITIFDTLLLKSEINAPGSGRISTFPEAFVLDPDPTLPVKAKLVK
jgi:hypothetical protein